MTFILPQVCRDESLSWEYDAAADASHLITISTPVDSMSSAVLPALKEILSAKLDVLVFCDIGMEPMTFLLAFERSAPVQVKMNKCVDTALSLYRQSHRFKKMMLRLCSGAIRSHLAYPIRLTIMCQ